METPRDRTQIAHYLTHHAPVLFLILDDAGTIRHANRFVCQYIGRAVTGISKREISVQQQVQQNLGGIAKKGNRRQEEYV